MKLFGTRGTSFPQPAQKKQAIGGYIMFLVCCYLLDYALSVLILRECQFLPPSDSP